MSGWFDFRRPTLAWHKSETFEVNPFRRYVGVEWEWDDFRANEENEHGDLVIPRVPEEFRELQERWTGLASVSDGSVSGPEVCTPPTNGDLFVERVEELGAILEPLLMQYPSEQSQSGGHVHVDRKGVNLQQLLRNWLYVQEVVWGGTHPVRLKHGYARPISVDDMRFSSHLRQDYGVSPEGPTIPDENRYQDLNFQSVKKHGTVEFRFPPGYRNSEELVSYAIMCVGIVDRAEELSQFRRAGADPLEALNGILPAPIFEALQRRRELFAADWQAPREDWPGVRTAATLLERLQWDRIKSTWPEWAKGD